MQSLKKYFTEGLIQVAILLSLVGIRVDVNPHYPPLREIILGQSSALTQTQFHNFRGSLDGHGLHPKSVELDNLLPTPRLLHWVRSLDYLHVPTAQLEAWLVHREPENSATMMPIQAGALDGDDVSIGLEDSAGLTMRMGAEDTAELGYGPVANESLQSGSSLSRIDNEDVKEEDEFSLWQQEPNHHVHQEQLSQGHREHLSLFNEDDEDELLMDRWRNQNPFDNQLGSILGGDVQFAGLGEDATFSFEECLQVLDANLPLEDQQHVVDAGADLPQYGGSLLSPLLSEHEPLLDLEQWQDVLAIMEPEDMDVSDPSDNSYINVDGSVRSIETGSAENPVHQNISLDQNTLPTSRQTFSFGGSHEDSCPPNQNQTRLVLNNSSNMDLNLNDSDIIDFLLSPPLVSPAYNNLDLHVSPMEDQGLSSLFDPLLEEAMFNQISLLDLSQEEGPGQLQDSQMEEQEETDSDSGLSLHFSPASPSGSESSCSSSSSSCSLSSTESAPEEGAVGYAHLKEEVTDDEEGAVGGCSPEQNKMISTNFPQAGHFHVGHDHTYIQPPCTSQRQVTKQRADEPLGHHIQDKVSTRDERRARAMKIPFSTDRIINLPVEEFNLLLAKHRLSEAQLALIRDIRRRGKNKMAAQNCRRRKLDMLLGLERGVDGLRRHRARLLREKSEILRSVREMKQRLNDLYQEVYSRLREEQGTLCSNSDATLQQGNLSHQSLSTDYGSESGRKSNKRRNDDE
ncbi:endoplasmic reticulum membrane sensor NFE2L1a [Brachyhypopomus gauderio]|uniref:endoplasmic reticulum membrane sensor NFE2L1a n=1 Tax=Brachyhypopomus gauderio TaxID=698409 RepID=UPI0040434A3B